jgi:hypothetical protein
MVNQGKVQEMLRCKLPPPKVPYLRTSIKHSVNVLSRSHYLLTELYLCFCKRSLLILFPDICPTSTSFLYISIVTCSIHSKLLLISKIGTTNNKRPMQV